LKSRKKEKSKGSRGISSQSVVLVVENLIQLVFLRVAYSTFTKSVPSVKVLGKSGKSVQEVDMFENTYQ
jgi:hypothetical protein